MVVESPGTLVQVSIQQSKGAEKRFFPLLVDVEYLNHPIHHLSPQFVGDFMSRQIELTLMFATPLCCVAEVQLVVEVLPLFGFSQTDQTEVCCSASCVQTAL